MPDVAGAAPGILPIASAAGVKLRLQGTLAERPGSLIDVYEKADLLVALTEKILQRFDKGHFNAVYFAGLQRNLAGLEDMVRASDVDRLGLFDKDMLIRCMKDAALSYRQVTGKVGLDNSLVIAKWLSMLPRWRQPPSAPSRTIIRPHETA
jgi:hypothetical protein